MIPREPQESSSEREVSAEIQKKAGVETPIIKTIYALQKVKASTHIYVG